MDAVKTFNQEVSKNSMNFNTGVVHDPLGQTYRAAGNENMYVLLDFEYLGTDGCTDMWLNSNHYRLRL